VFDSGLGGLTVVRALERELPAECLVYFGDTARLPYGNKSKVTVERLSLEALRFLSHFEIKALVVACNSASARALDVLQAEAPFPVLGVVEAGAARAAAATRNGRVGVIGTRATVRSGCYERALAARREGLRVIAEACPLFVPLVEEGWIDHEVTRAVARHYLEPLRAGGVDTCILGCTHYPLLGEVIGEVLGGGVTLIDSGESVAAEVAGVLGDRGLRARAPAPGHRYRFFVSDQPEQFAAQGARFLSHALVQEVRVVDQSAVPWYDRWAGRDAVPGEEQR
jgi:glutamate racemase